MNLDSIHKWILQILKTADRPFLLGINGPQGAGKSTLSAALCERLGNDGFKALAISIDDFYLSRTEQVRLAAKYPENPYLQQRGYPGTHDIALGTQTLAKLRTLPRALGPASALRIPRYDKSAHQGKGDRLPESQWTKISAAPDLIILEGWMLGFTPVAESALPNVQFKVINEFLHSYRDWHEQLDGFLQLQPDDYRHVLTWRVEAEEKMKASGKPGMTKQEITQYAELFMPAYATYLPQLASKPPVRTSTLVVPITKSRLNLSEQ